MKNKLLGIMISVFCICACLVTFSACGSNKGEIAPIEITEKTYRDNVLLNQEFDVMSVVENKDDSLTYEITELFYLDGNFKRVNIEYSGTKFTQTAPYDVNVTLQASRGRKSVEVEFVIEFFVESNKTADAFVGSWANEGVTRMIVSSEDNLFNGATFAIKVSYIGNIQRPNDGVNIGRLDKSNEDMSVKNWGNAVFTADVYNPQDYDLEMGILFGIDRDVWNNDNSFDSKFYYAPQILKAKKCTTVAWSLKSYNITRNFFADNNKSLQVKVRIADEFVSQFAEPYSYSLFINNLDVTDYSVEKFPNLDTTYVAPIKIDNGASLSFNNSWASSVVKREATTDENFLRNNSKYAFKVDVSRNDNRTHDQIGIISTAENCSLTKWENAVLTADVYNSTDKNLVMGLLFADSQNNIWLNDGKIANANILNEFTLTPNSWTKVAWSMKAFGINSNIFADGVTIQIKTGFKDTVGLVAPYEYSMAITNLDFVDYSAEKFPSLDTKEPFTAVMNNKASESFRDSYKGGAVTRVLSQEESCLRNGSTFGFDIGVNSNTSQANIVGMIHSAEDCLNTSWDNVVLVADVYNSQNYDLEMGLTFADSSNNLWLNNGIIENVSFLKPITLSANGWTTVAWSMKVFGIGSNIFDEDVGIQVKTRIKDASGLTAPYVYNLAITNLDFVDYSQEKFPDLSLYYGTHHSNDEVNQGVGFTAGEINTISFDYCIHQLIQPSGVVKVHLRTDDVTANKLGAFEFNADGEKTDYAGVTTTDLGNGYIRVAITVDDVTQTVGAPTLNTLNKICFERWGGATYYFGNIQVTYKTAN